MTLAIFFDHLSIVLASLILAVIIGLPLGIFVHMHDRMGKIVLKIIDLIQTTPALALLGIIMVFMGAGKPTAVIGLALYSLLPIVRNTSLGLDQVPDHLKEAATGMGMKPFYRLVHVEMPLALPMLFTGLRIAIANAIGTAVFAATVSGGGIGNLINNGIRQQNLKLILIGMIALMIMAFVLDLIMGWAENYFSNPKIKRLPHWLSVGGGTILAIASLVLVIFNLTPPNTEGQLVIYDGDYSEVKIMHSMIKQLIENKTDLNVIVRDPMTQINNYKELIGENPSCDLMFSYDGTVLTTFLGKDVTDVPKDSSLIEYVREILQNQEGVKMLEKVGINNTYAVAVSQETANKYNLKTISDLVPYASQLTIGAEHEFFTSAGSMKYQPFSKYYNLKFKKAVPVDVSLKYTAMEKGDFDVLIVYSTDGLNRRANLKILEDDLHFFPEYNGVFLTKKNLFDSFANKAPELEKVLNILVDKVSNQDMIDLTYAVDVEKKDVTQVAHDFLVNNKLLE